MNRQEMIAQLESHSTEWDMCIIGGGATGLGTAVDASSRGFKTLLAEQHDFAKGTSSRSTKLIHGGVRYLQQGNIKLVKEALQERGLLHKNAPHLVKKQTFILPNYKWWDGAFYGIGLKMYDWMAGRLNFGQSKILSAKETLRFVPTLNPAGLRGGVLFYDGQFNDARLAINLANTATLHGGTVINYMKVTGLLKTGKKIYGVQLNDLITGINYEARAKTVVNATGIFTDHILQLDNESASPIITLSQGIHLVVDKAFLPGDTAIIIPGMIDGRVLFAVPWHNKTLIGTTDTPVSHASLEPVALQSEIDFILAQIGKYLSKKPGPEDIKSIYAGLRPLVKKNARDTASLPRDHVIQQSDSGLITVTGGKWTTYRKMAEDVVDIAISSGAIEKRKCITKTLAIHGSGINPDYDEHLHYYGTDAASIKQLVTDGATLGEKIHPLLPYIKAEIVWAARMEMCMTIEDALARRTRALLLDARASVEAAPIVAALMARELNVSEEWEAEQVGAFTAIAKNYLPA